MAESRTDLEHAQMLAATLSLVLYELHPVYGSTAKWGGGIGGAAITAHCSLIHGAHPGHEYAEAQLHEDPLRDFLRDHPGFDLAAARTQLVEELRRRYEASVAPRPEGD